MASQPNAQQRLAMKLRADRATPATGSGATEFAFSPSQGLTPEAAAVVDDTIRSEGWAETDGVGSRSGAAQFLMRLSPAKQDLLWPLLARRTAWQTLADITEVQVVSGITTVTDGVVFGSGNPTSLGVFAGMRFKLTGHSTAGNNARWIDVVGVTATKIITPTGSLTINAVADTVFTITFAKFLTIPTIPVPQWLDIELWRTAQLKGRNLLQAQLSSAALATGKNAKVGVTFGFVSDDWDLNDTGTARFTSPTKGGGNNVVTSDGLYYRNGTDVKNIITDFSANFALATEEDGVLGPTSSFSTGEGRITGTFSVVAQDLAYMTDIYNKTPFALMFVAEDTGANPKSGMSFYFGKCMAPPSTDGLTPSGNIKDQFQWSAGIDDTGAGRAVSPFVITSTAP